MDNTTEYCLDESTRQLEEYNNKIKEMKKSICEMKAEIKTKRMERVKQLEDELEKKYANIWRQMRDTINELGEEYKEGYSENEFMTAGEMEIDGCKMTPVWVFKLRDVYNSMIIPSISRDNKYMICVSEDYNTEGKMYRWWWYGKMVEEIEDGEKTKKYENITQTDEVIEVLELLEKKMSYIISQTTRNIFLSINEIQNNYEFLKRATAKIYPAELPK